MAADPAETAKLDGQALRTLLLALERCGHDPLRFVDGGFERVRVLAHPRGAVDWHDYVSILERVQARGRGELARVAQAYAVLHPPVRVLAGYLLTGRHFFKAAATFTVGGRWSDGEVRELAGGVLELDFRLVRGRRPSRAYFEFTGLVFAALPEVLGFQGTRVTLVDVSPTRGRYRVRSGRTGGLAQRLSDAHVAAVVGHVLDTRNGHATSGRAAVPSVAALEARYSLTRAEARVARRLAMGRSLKHIAKELEISPETARTHAKRAMQKTQTHRQAELVSVVLGCERR
jgi:DNA-binding CsgD family transcriptional regulator